jgi:glycosyltransferase involved in cell wall biosynthesis
VGRDRWTLRLKSRKSGGPGVNDLKYRLLFVATHPVQYVAPQLRLMARHPRLELLVAYVSLRGARPHVDRDFGVQVEWDVPLLEGYQWLELGRANQGERATWQGLRRKLQLWHLVKNGEFEALYVSGYHFLDAWVALVAAKCKRIAIIFATDAHALESRKARSPLAKRIKRAILRRVFALAGAVVVSSSGGIEYVKSLGVDESRIFLGGSVVDNGWWTERAAQVDRAAVRRRWNIPIEASVVLFCAKLQSWKRPADLLEAFSRANVPGSYLVFAGDGPLRATLEKRAEDIGIAERVQVLGFVNQTGLPDIYVASDLLVLPSEYEPFGLVVNEAMLCSCPAVVSDRVGAKYDLVREGETGRVFPCGDIDALTSILRSMLGDRFQLEQLGEAAKERMKTWTPEANTEMFVRAIKYAAKSESELSRRTE